MFGWLKQRHKDLEEAVAHTEQARQHAIAQLNELQDLVKQEQVRLTEIQNDYVVDSLAKLTKFSCAIDWGLMKAFSVERAYPNSESRVDATVIGYYRPDGSIGEWFLWTDEQTHNKLVAEFIEHRK